mgnify:FL=1
MGKLKDYHFGNMSFRDYEDDFLDDDYPYDDWKKKAKKRKQDQQGEYGDDWIDGVDE